MYVLQLDTQHTGSPKIGFGAVKRHRAAAPGCLQHVGLGCRECALFVPGILKEGLCISWLQGQTLKQHIDLTLGQGNIREAVLLPPGEDINEWLAVNTVDFYNAVSVLYGTLLEFCTTRACPIMAAGPKVWLHCMPCLILRRGVLWEQDSVRPRSPLSRPCL
jgi:hypothetical protein